MDNEHCGRKIYLKAKFDVNFMHSNKYALKFWYMNGIFYAIF